MKARIAQVVSPVRFVRTDVVGPKVSSELLGKGILALAGAILLMLVYIWFRFELQFGLGAVAALFHDVFLTFGPTTSVRTKRTGESAWAIWPFTTSTVWPGLAPGGVWNRTMAVAVDANVLIYERMRDEANAGRAAMAAADAGYRRAMTSIFDANVTTMISALIMFSFGAGPVKGFAWTLSIGVLTTIFSAVLVTQILLAWWFRATRPKTLPIA